MEQVPGLFGVDKSNRDFTNLTSWGKNQFNSSFPAALACYMYSSDISPVYLKLNEDLSVFHTNIDVSNLFGLAPMDENLHFAFERDFTPYQIFVEGDLPRVDLVTMNISDSRCLSGLEVKLTALPDQTTYNLTEDNYGCELVIRPDTIVYLAISIAMTYQDNRQELYDLLNPICSRVSDWESTNEILLYIQDMINAIDTVLLSNLDKQTPLVMQPIWKTMGKSSKLADNCLDMFIWSNFAFTRLFIDNTRESLGAKSISRLMRTSVWLTKMLYDFAINGKINHEAVIDKLSYNTRNDKAFSFTGVRTHRYMACNELTNPRIPKTALKDIILNGGEKFLSPERRFDAVIVNTPGLFD
ncbi:HindVP family restriction endonuclease [Bacillus cereus]|uniref:HindVP family restriction endonuclease n=1 Tax=Bacillus cereus TaxID=1396 RepID=UPI004054B93A